MSAPGDPLEPQRLTVRAEDGTALEAWLFEPPGGAGAGTTVIVCSAMLVSRRFYAPFARFLTERAMRVLTFDFRGSGDNLAATARGVARLAHWGERDVSAAISWARSTAPADRLVVVGHSMGGRLVALSPELSHVDAVVTVASTTPWWGYWPVPYAAAIRAWYAAAGRFCTVAPVLPAHWVKMGPPVASSVIQDWVQWGVHGREIPGSARADPTTAAATPRRALAMSFSDDVGLGCKRSIDEGARPYAALGGFERWHLGPRELGVRHIGHFGYFRGAAARPLWQRTLAWLAASAERR